MNNPSLNDQKQESVKQLLARNAELVEENRQLRAQVKGLNRKVQNLFHRIFPPMIG